MLKHIPIPTVPSTSVAERPPPVLTTFSQPPNARSTRPTPITTNLNRSQQPLNVSTLTTASNGGPSLLQTTFPNHTHHQTPLLTHNSYPSDVHKPIQNGHVPRMFTPLPTFSSNSQQHLLKSCGNGNNNNLSNVSSSSTTSKNLVAKENTGAREALTSLGLLCLVSLLLALLSLTFLLKISPGTNKQHQTQQQHLLGTSIEEYAIVFDVTLALCALSLSLNLCCLLVCAVQFLFTVKLLGSSSGVAGMRENKYLQKSSVSRVCAIGGFFISIPIFLTGIILYTFTQFHSTPAIVTSILIGISILFCGGAMVHNVFVWQKEKTIVFNCMKKQMLQVQHHHPNMSHLNSSMHHPVPQAPLIARQTPLNLSLNSPISTIHNPLSSTRDITLDQINNHSYVNGEGLKASHYLNTTLNNTHLSLLSQAHTPNSYFLRTTPPTPKSAQLQNGSPNASADPNFGDQTTSFRNTSVTTAHELSNFNLSTLV